MFKNLFFCPPDKQKIRIYGWTLDNDDKVVYQSPEGQLKVGFAEKSTNPQGDVQVWLRENPFDKPPQNKNSMSTIRPRGSINSIFRFYSLLSCVKKAKIRDADAALLILKKLADS